MSMINFGNKTFGNQTVAATPAAERPKAEFWLNIGYTSDVEDNDGNKMFVSLPQGLALDTQEPLKTNSRNSDFAQFQAARNDLLDKLIEHAQNLKPGESTIINLEIQLRRVNEEAAPVDATNNVFTKQLSL